jgi:VanZ family protein
MTISVMSTTTPTPSKAPPGRRAFAWLTAALWVYVSWQALRSNPGGSDFGQLDKLQHLGAFMALTAASALALAPTKSSRLPWAQGLALAGGWMLYGGLIEVLQAFIPGRQPSWLDLLADAAGIAAGLALAHALRRWPVLSRRL